MTATMSWCDAHKWTLGYTLFVLLLILVVEALR